MQAGALVVASMTALGLSAALLSGCVAPRWDAPPNDHFDGKRFYNEEPFDVGLADLVRFYASREPGVWKRNLAITPALPPPSRVDDGSVRMTFINHATVLIQVDGLNLLTDPIWSERASPLSWLGPRRFRPAGVRFEDLPPIDVVMISHNHYDHLDIPTLKRLAASHRPVMVVAAGDQKLLQAAGINHVVALDWWQQHRLPNGCALSAVPVKHWSGRRLLPGDRNLSLWAGYVLETKGGPVYFAGDTGYDAHFKATHARFGAMRAALLPIGAYKPRWLTRYQHMSPADAVRAHLDLQAAFSLGIHHGTFELADDGMHEPAAQLARILRKHGLHELRFPAGIEGTAYSLAAKEQSSPCDSQGTS